MCQREIAVVVGSTGAMGTAITRRLASSGLKVVAVARTADALRSLVSSTPGVHACVADIADDSATDVIRASLDAPVRMVVQGAGVATAGGVLTAPTATVVESVNIKVGGMLRLVRAVDGHLVKGARLVAIGGHYGFEPSAYAATAGVANAALANLVRQLSWAYGERGVTAHLVAPGPADTERLRRVAADRGSRDGTSAEAVLRQMRAESAIGAFTTVEQIAWAMVTLLAPQADALAGGTLFMDAGRRKALP
ncbi:enoyl-[acyl-carrier-protein] reductase [NADPH] [Pandoraea terrae]|uniref:Enoyl-[acyl-carrier-protein] reductase [NADPH] n=1 Tax=Pandoraea terrae TaxID=1537710 RepID=A0A5E4U8S9_9BURK|nr:SDR family oxidoreductase [Pandoraea terrae]VVD96457.1 enoyl-[acyl-carrier-protein] reductase [NADPH] [Pandoraea terrae]